MCAPEYFDDIEEKSIEETIFNLKTQNIELKRKATHHSHRRENINIKRSPPLRHIRIRNSFHRI